MVWVLLSITARQLLPEKKLHYNNSRGEFTVWALGITLWNSEIMYWPHGKTFLKHSKRTGQEKKLQQGRNAVVLFFSPLLVVLWSPRELSWKWILHSKEWRPLSHCTWDWCIYFHIFRQENDESWESSELFYNTVLHAQIAVLVNALAYFIEIFCFE